MAEKKIFVYKARLPDGRFVEGQIKAESQQIVVEDFNKRNISLLEIQEQSLLSRDIKIFKPRVKPREVSQLMRQLATMTDAAIPLTRCVDVLREQATNPAMREVLSAIRADIEVGATLANAVAKHPKVFSPITVSMIRAGEAGGFLTPDVLVSIAENLEAETKLKNKIRSALAYPIMVMVLIFIIVAALVVFIVPQFAKTFADAGVPLPLPTQILVDVSNLVQGPGVLVVLAIIAGIVYMWRKNSGKPEFKRKWEPIKYRMPVFGKLNKKIIVARFARNFGSLLDAGLPIMQNLEVVGSTSGSIQIEDSLKEVAKSVSVGELISPQLRKFPIYPNLLVEMLSVGEEAGEMPVMLEKIAEAYDYEVESTTDALTSLLEPLLVVVMGVVVGGILISLYLPMFTMYSFVGNV